MVQPGAASFRKRTSRKPFGVSHLSLAESVRHRRVQGDTLFGRSRTNQLDFAAWYVWWGLSTSSYITLFCRREKANFGETDDLQRINAMLRAELKKGWLAVSGS